MSEANAHLLQNTNKDSEKSQTESDEDGSSNKGSAHGEGMSQCGDPMLHPDYCPPGRSYKMSSDLLVLDEVLSPIWIIDMSPEGDKNLWVNQSCCNAQGLSREEIINIDFKEGRTPFMRDFCLNMYNTVQVKRHRMASMRKALYYKGQVAYSSSSRGSLSCPFFNEPSVSSVCLA